MGQHVWLVYHIPLCSQSWKQKTFFWWRWTLLAKKLFFLIRHCAACRGSGATRTKKNNPLTRLPHLRWRWAQDPTGKRSGWYVSVPFFRPGRAPLLRNCLWRSPPDASSAWAQPRRRDWRSRERCRSRWGCERSAVMTRPGTVRKSQRLSSTRTKHTR